MVNWHARGKLGISIGIAVLLTACGVSKHNAFHDSSGDLIANFEDYQNFQSRALIVSSPDCDETCQRYRTEFRYVAYVGKQIYCYWDQKKSDTGFDYDALAQELENSITNDTTTTERYLLLRQWASAFHDGHVNVMLTSDQTDIEVYSAPVRVEVLAPATDHEKVIIAATERGLDIQVGDEVLSVDGVPVKDALTTAAATSSSGSTDRMRRFWAGRRLVDVLGAEKGSAPFELEVQPASGAAAKKVMLYRKVQISPRGGAGSSATADNTGLSGITVKILPNSIGYLRIDGFSGSQDDFLLSQAMSRVSQTRGLVIDLRSNGGGDLSGDRIIERLASTPVVRYKRSERLSDFILSQRASDMFTLTPDSSGLFAQWHDLTVTPTTEHYGKPVVALTSPYCFSACDTFSSALKENNLATFVGEGTGGGTGTPLVFDLPYSPFQFRYSVIRGQTPTGNAIEGVGTLPDLYVEPTIADRQKQEDSQLLQALAVIESKLAGSLAGIPAAASLSKLLPTQTARLDISPTEEENAMLVRFSSIDEVR